MNELLQRYESDFRLFLYKTGFKNMDGDFKILDHFQMKIIPKIKELE